VANLEKSHEDLGATEESECDSSPLAGGGREANMFCADEGMHVSQSTGFPVAGRKLLFTEKLERKLQVTFNLWASRGSCL
jgi:hypothetical protein